MNLGLTYWVLRARERFGLGVAIVLALLGAAWIALVVWVLFQVSWWLPLVVAAAYVVLARTDRG